jgi:Family of unknown function (DUF6812)
MNPDFDEKGKIYTHVITKQPVRVIVQTADHRIIGNLHIRPGERVIDELNRGDKFVAITAAVVMEKSGEELYHCDFLALNHESVTWIIPEKDVTSLPPDV